MATSRLMLSVSRALLVQQLIKLGAAQSSVFGDLKARMPTASEALPGNYVSSNYNDDYLVVRQ